MGSQEDNVGGAFGRETTTIPGPEFNGKPTVVSIYWSKQLRACPLLPGLFKTINLAYLASDQKSFGTTTGDRLSSIDDLVLVLRNDPSSFTILHSQPEFEGEVLSTASCRRYYGPEADTSRLWACTHLPEPNVEEWELKMVASHLSVQGKGLASSMLELVEKEILSRSAAHNTGSTQCRTKAIICTPETTFAEFYRRRGYIKDYVRPFRNAHTSFDICFIQKMLHTEERA